MPETPGMALRRARHQHNVPIRVLCKLLDTSSSAVNYVERGRRSFPMRWLPLLPPVIAIPVIEAFIADNRAELDEFVLLLADAKAASLSPENADARRHDAAVGASAPVARR